MEEMPLLNRRITYLPLLNAANRPAINQGDVFMNEDLFTTNGAGRRQAWFEVDGGTGNDSWGRQTIFSNIPLAAVQEMTILENAFSAEYGGSTGSAINIITKSGGNQFHGEVMELWRPSATEAALDGFNSSPTRPAATMSRATRWASRRLALGGPIGSAGPRIFSRPANSAARIAPRRLFRRSSRAATSAIIAAGWGSCGWIIRSTTATICFFAATWMAFTTRTRTASSAGTACPAWRACFTAGLTPKKSAKRRCCARRC